MEDNELIFDMYKKIDEELNKIIQRQDDFELRLESLEAKRNEIYYQKFLEKRLGATHKRTIYGITDLSTKDEHVEIKQWRDYKTALGQLLSYNFKIFVTSRNGGSTYRRSQTKQSRPPTVRHGLLLSNSQIE